VLLAYNGVPVAHDGTVALPGSAGRAWFDHLVSLYAPSFTGPKEKSPEIIQKKPSRINRRGGSESAFVALPTLRVLRPSTGEELHLSVRPAAVEPLVPPHLHGSPSSFLFGAGGLLFVPLSQPLLAEAYGPDWNAEAPPPLVAAAFQGEASLPGQQVVLLLSVSADPANAGFHSLARRAVLSVGGAPVLNLRHLRSLLARASSLPVSSPRPIPSPSAGVCTLELQGGPSIFFETSRATAEADRRAAEGLGAPQLASLDLEAEPTGEELRLWARVETAQELLQTTASGCLF
jgi:hypothetical protein